MDEKEKIASKIELLNKQHAHACHVYGVAKKAEDREAAQELMEKLGKQIDELQERMKTL